MSGIWVVVESNNGAVKNVAIEMLAAAGQLSAQGMGEVAAYVCGTGCAESAAKLAEYGAQRVVTLEGASDKGATPDELVDALVSQAQAGEPAAILFAEGALGRELSPQIAQALDTGLVSDVIGLEAAESPVFVRLPYSGKVVERVAFEPGVAPLIATVRASAFAALEPTPGATAPVEALPLNALAARRVILDVVRSSSTRVDLAEADVVVSGGRGVKGPEGFKLLEELADVLGAAVGASRPAVDEGWIDIQYQVGQTGKIVAPQLYIACGISGSIQHLAGMSSSKCIVAINKDPEAEIFAVADYGIVADLFTVVPLLTQELKVQLNA